MSRYPTHRFTIYSFIIALIAIALMGSCVSEGPASGKDLLRGRWEIVSAERNNKPTESLANLYFEFLSGNLLHTNMTPTGTDTQGSYELKDDVLEQTTPELSAIYTIKELSDSILYLETRLHGTFFEFNLRRAADQVPEEDSGNENI